MNKKASKVIRKYIANRYAKVIEENPDVVKQEAYKFKKEYLSLPWHQRKQYLDDLR